MRCAIVSSSLLSKERDWTAARFLGDPVKLGPDVVKAQYRLRLAESRLRLRLEEYEAERARLLRLHRSGDVLMSADRLQDLLPHGEGI